MSKKIEGPTYSFPAIRGIQATREYYVTMFPLKLIPRIFIFDDEEIGPELRAQRTLNQSRIPELSKYIVQNPKDYIFSAITASIDADIEFSPYETTGYGRNIGQVSIPMDSKLLINDGQHRRAAIEEALKKNPDLGTETIAVVLFVDLGLKKSQQMFSDLNKHAVRLSRSLGILYDHRDPISNLCKKLIKKVEIFKDRVELEKTTISNRSLKLFTLSAIYQSTRALLGLSNKVESISEKQEKLAVDYWNIVAENMYEWQLLLEKKVSGKELREGYIHVHGIALHALGVVGCELVNSRKTWKAKLKTLNEIDWSRSNHEIWEGRAMSGGRITKTENHLILTTNFLKETLKLKLSPKEKQVEENFLKSKESTQETT